MKGTPLEIMKQNQKYGGVLDLTACYEQELDALLAQVPIEDVWGIGHKYTLFLTNYGIQILTI